VLPAEYHVPWGEFRVTFCGHHLSAGTMRHKLAEFLDLHQGNPSVYEYTQEFNTWHSMGVIMLIQMRRKPSSFARGLLFSCRIA
jgi:uncharacterized membrane protein